jgi:hypothetical protein
MKETNSKDNQLYTLDVTNKVVSEEGIHLIGELTRLHASQRIKSDPKAYEGLPPDDQNFPDDVITDEWTAEEWNTFMEKSEDNTQKKRDIYFANGGWTNAEAHIYYERNIKPTLK